MDAIRVTGPPTRLAAVSVASLSLILFAALAVAVMNGGLASFDEAIREAVHGWLSDVTTTLAFNLTRLGSIAVIAALSAVAGIGFWFLGRRQTSIGIILFMAGALILENGFKYTLERVRPEAFFGVSPETFSFPSGHALLSLCFYGSMAGLLATRWNSPARAAIYLLTSLLVIGIGLSRIFIGVHYPTDVIGGYLIAIFWAGIFWFWWPMERALKR